MLYSIKIKITFSIKYFSILLIMMLQNTLCFNTQFYHGIYPLYNAPNVHTRYNQGYSTDVLSSFNTLPNRQSVHPSKPDSSEFHRWPLWNSRVHSTILRQSPWDRNQPDSLENESGNIDDRISPKIDELPWNICGLSSNQISLRIIGGRKADPKQFPWIARLGYITPNSSNIIYRCGGTLINFNHIITAAHCVTDLPNSMRLVRVRLADAAESENSERAKNFNVNQIFIYPRYNSPRLRHDVAIVRLDRTVKFSSYLSPICLPNFESSNNRTGQQATVVGWETFLNNTETFRRTKSSELQKADLIIEDRNRCQQSMARNAGISIGQGQLCATGSRNGKSQDSCAGDSGGPLQRIEKAGNPIQGEIRVILIGLVSFGPRRCGTQRISAVYTDVAEYMPWILSVI